MADSQLTKVCTKCNRSKSISDFSKQANGKYGVTSQCTECRRARGREYARQVRSGDIQTTPRRSAPEGHKHCPICQEVKPLDAFGMCAATKTGRNSFCLECLREYHRQRRAAKSDTDFIRMQRLRFIEEAEAKAGVGFKCCRRCLSVLPCDNFPVAKTRRDKLGSYCIKCRKTSARIAQRERRQHREVREKIRKSQQAARSTVAYKDRRKAYRSQPNVRAKEKTYRDSERSKQLQRQSRMRSISKGNAISQIATTIGHGHARANKIDNHTQQMIVAYQSGLSTYDIAKELGTYGPAVAYRLMRSGIKLRSKSQSSKHVSLPKFGKDNCMWVDLPLDEIKRLYEHGYSALAIGEKFGVSATPITTRLKKMGVTFRGGWGTKITGEDGHVTRSTLECNVCNWLFRHGVGHITEPPCPWCHLNTKSRMRADFLVGDVYIEVWGVNNSPDYDRQASYKRRQYAKHGATLLEVFDTSDLNTVLRQLLTHPLLT